MKTQMTSDNTSSVVRRMLPRHFKILDMVLAGHKSSAIAETLEMNKDTISALTRSPIFQAELTRRRREEPLSDILRMDREAVIGKARSILEQAICVLPITASRSILRISLRGSSRRLLVNSA